MREVGDDAGATSSPLGATPCRDGVNFSVFSRQRHRGRAAALRPRRRRAGRRASIRLDPVANRTYHYWHVFVPGVTAGPDLRLSRARAVRSGERACASIRPRCCSIRMAAAWWCRDGYSREAAARAGRQRRDGDEERGGRSVAPTTGKATRRCAGRRRGPSSTRCTCAASPAIPSSGVGREDARHLRRPDREDSVPAGTRHHRGRTAAGVPVRRAGLPAGTGQLLGLRAGLVLRAAPGVQLAPGSARAGRRVPRHGQGAAPGGHRSHSRRRLQPHRRRRPARADALLSRAGQRRLLHPRGRTARATPTTAAPATRSTPTIRSSAG